MKRTDWLRTGILLAVLGGAAGQPVWPQRRQPLPRIPRMESEEPVRPTHPSTNRKMLRASFEQLQKDVKQLFELSAALKEEISKANEDILPVSGIKKAEEIEKLAKKIQGRIKNL